jgi:hypothetical protein
MIDNIAVAGVFASQQNQALVSPWQAQGQFPLGSAQSRNDPEANKIAKQARRLGPVIAKVADQEVEVEVAPPVRGKQSERRVAEALSQEMCSAVEYLIEDFALYLKANKMAGIEDNFAHARARGCVAALRKFWSDTNEVRRGIG